MTTVRIAVRVGVVVVAVAALVAVVCSFLPGHDVYRTNAEECFDRAFDLWGHGGDAPCVHREWHVGTEPAGDALTALGVLLAALPGVLVWRAGTARAAGLWALALVGAIVLFAAYAILTYEDSGCVTGIRREPRWPAVLLSWSSLVVYLGPVVVAAVAGVLALVARVTSRRAGDASPPARR